MLENLAATMVETLEVAKEVIGPIEAVEITKEALTETVEVVREILPTGLEAGVYKVQMGAFENENYAIGLYNLLREEYGDLVYIEYIPPYWKVRIGKYTSYNV